MKILSIILLRIYTLWSLLIFTVCVIVFLPFSVVPFLISERAGAFTYRVFFLWAWLFSFFSFIKFKINGKELVEKNNSYVFVVNHTSFLDAIGIALAIPVQFRTLAKKELAKIPLLGLILKKSSVIVDRSNPQSRKESITKMKVMLDKGISILIFPEGTQNRSDKLLTEFHTGAFRIAKDTATAIIPVVIKGAGQLMPPSSFTIRPGTIEITIKNEISLSTIQSHTAEELSQKVFDLMWNELTDVKKERAV